MKAGKRDRVAWMRASATGGLKVLCAVAAIAVFGVLAERAEAQNVAEPCSDAWDDAPASSYCSSTSVSRVGAGTLTTTVGNCIIEVSSCSITVSVDDNDQTFTPTWPSSYTSTGDGVSLDSTDDIDICFASATSGYTATVKTGCASGETGSASATSNGL